MIESIRVDVKSGTFPFAVVTMQDGVKYQVKLPNYETTSMLNEYIAHEVANNISCRVPQSSFILFQIEEIEYILEMILNSSHKYKNLYENYNFDQIKNEKGEFILFGIEYLEDKVIIPEDVDEFQFYFEELNDDSFYSLYSYDLYLHNHDRHCGNLMFQSDNGRKYVSLLIDHDKIFGSDSGIERLSELKNDFNCIRNIKNEFLYTIITNTEQIDLITKYSKDIEAIENRNIDNIFKCFLEKCNRSILKYEAAQSSIIDFLLYRKSKIVNVFEEQEYEVCYG